MENRQLHPDFAKSHLQSPTFSVVSNRPPCYVIGVCVGYATFTDSLLDPKDGGLVQAVIKGVSTFFKSVGFINNMVNAIYYEFSSGESDLNSGSYTDEGYISRWRRLDYTKQQTGDKHYGYNAWRYYSEYNLHMYGWLATGWSYDKGIFGFSDIALKCKTAEVEPHTPDDRPIVYIPTIILGLFGF